MDCIGRFVNTIKRIGWSEDDGQKLVQARAIVSELNRFLFTRQDGLGTVEALGKECPFFSEFQSIFSRQSR